MKNSVWISLHKIYALVRDFCLFLVVLSVPPAACSRQEVQWAIRGPLPRQWEAFPLYRGDRREGQKKNHRFSNEAVSVRLASPAQRSAEATLIHYSSR